MNLAKYIDHTILKPTVVEADIRKLCNEAAEYNFAAVCVNPCYIDLAVSLLKGTDVKVATVIGFPLGANTSAVKAFEAKDAAARGADEIDMVINIGAAKQGEWQAVLDDIKAVVAASEKIVKVIVETALLTEAEKKLVCEVVLSSGAHYIKTSTGFSSGGATVEDIKLFKAIVGDKIGIKASGGIRTRGDADLMIAAGATRLGTSAGIAIVK